MKQIKFGLLLLMYAGLIVGISWWRFSSNHIEQDHYLEYAQAIRRGTVDIMPLTDKRLLPGLPWLAENMYVGYVLVWGSAIGSAVLLFLLTRSLRSIIGLLFPPVLLSAGTIIGTEMPTVFLLLLALYLLKKKKYWLAATAIGLGIWMRLIMVVAAVVIGISLLKTGQRKAALTIAWVFMLFVAALLLWNLFVFGDMAIQLKQNVEYGRATFGIWQLMLDVPRAISWGWYRQVVSGLFYMGLLSVGLLSVIRRQAGEWKYLVTSLVAVMTLFVFAIGPTPFLEEFPRFLVPVFPLIWLLSYDRIPGKWVWGLPLISLLILWV